MNKEFPVTTAPVAHVYLRITMRCPLCARRLERQVTLTVASLTTGNTTEQASYALDALKNDVEREATERGWVHQMCGRCRDMTEEERKQVRGAR